MLFRSIVYQFKHIYTSNIDVDKNVDNMNDTISLLFYKQLPEEKIRYKLISNKPGENDKEIIHGTLIEKSYKKISLEETQDLDEIVNFFNLETTDSDKIQ